MSDLFHDQLQALRAQSLHRKLREIGSAQGPEVRIIGQQLAKFLASHEGEERRQCLWRRIKTLRASLPPHPGVPSSPSDGHETGSAIHPWMVGDEQGAIASERGLSGPGHPISDGCKRLGSAPDHDYSRARRAANSRLLCGTRAPRERLLEDRDASGYGLPMALVRSKGEGTRAGFRIGSFGPSAGTSSGPSAGGAGSFRLDALLLLA
jgi:hypothetical protein